MQYSEQTKQKNKKVSEKKEKKKREIDGKTRGCGPLFILRLVLSFFSSWISSCQSCHFCQVSVQMTDKPCPCTRLKYIVVMSITINTNPPLIDKDGERLRRRKGGKEGGQGKDEPKT